MILNLNELATALVEFQKKMPKIEKNSTTKVQLKGGGSYSFNYADLLEVSEKAIPVLSDCGLAISQMYDSDGINEYIVTLLIHKSGQMLTSKKKIPTQYTYMDKDGVPHTVDAFNGPQEEGSYLTYMRRYCFCSICGLVSQEDDDGNVASKATKDFSVSQNSQQPQKNAQHAGPRLASQAQVNALKKRFPEKKDGWDILTADQAQEMFNQGKK